MYETFYSLNAKPFKIVPNPTDLFLSPRYENALTYLEYGLMEKAGFIMLTGEIGMGKTTLIRYLLNKLEPDMEVGVIFNTNVTSEQILKLILMEFQLPVSNGDKSQMLDTLYQFLIEQYRQEKPVLLIIDEAQNLSEEALEEVRMLSNLQSDEEILLQVMIVGQPELRDKLQKPGLRQFSQRIAVSYHLSPLSRDESVRYIAHRLKAADGSPDIFLPEAMDLIYEYAKGIPRTINLLCDACLVYGFADEIDRIGKNIVQQVIDDKEGMGIITGVGEEDADGEVGLTDELVNRLTSADGSIVEKEGRSPHHSDAVEKGIEVRMEKRIAMLEKRLKGSHAALDKKIGNIQHGLIRKLFQMLLIERKHNARIMREYGRLLERYRREKKEQQAETIPEME